MIWPILRAKSFKKSSMKIDFEKLKTDLAGQILQLAEHLVPGGRVEGHEYLMLNPLRQDSQLGSFKINIVTGQWADFAANEKGSDIISFTKYIKGFQNMGQASDFLAQEAGLQVPQGPGAVQPAPAGVPIKKDIWTPILPVPAGVPAPFKEHFKHGVPANTWAYKNAAGETLGYIYRFDLKEDLKEIWPVTYCKNEKGAKAWRWLSFPKPRPLYGLELLPANPGDQVLLVEGEKTADAAREIFKGVAVQVLTWPGGTKAVGHVDFKPLKGRRVVIWPDNDQGGITAADEIGMMIKGFVDGVKIVIPPLQAPKAWDLANALEKGWTLDQTVNYLKKNLRDPVEPIRPPAGPPDDPSAQDEEVIPPNSKAFNVDLYPFRPLGYDRTYFYYLPEGAQQIVRMVGEQHDEKHITAYLAPVDFWQDIWTVTKKRKNQTTGEWEQYRSGIDWRAIKRFLIWTMQYGHGVYSGGDSVRGPGIWRDNKRFVVHLGDRLLVDGKVTSMSKIPSHYIYEKTRTREREKFEPLPATGSIELLHILDRFSWTREINARLMGGWLVAGLVGGSLPWRPHVWINGPQACGKSSVIKEVARRVLGDCIAIFIEGATTEAGLRQQANHCSFPILFDEAESTDRRGQIRIDQIIELMRSSASPDGGKMLKGTPGGSALSFDVQSCFCLASISNNSRLAADVARIVNLEMVDPSGNEKWEIMQREIMDMLNAEWAGRFRARIFHMLPSIKNDIALFIKAARDELDSQRFGDVYGVLLGASHCIASDEPATLEQAREFVKAADWTEERAQKYLKDEINCLMNIMQRIVTVKEDRIQDKTIWELIKIAYCGPLTAPADGFGLKNTKVITSGEALEASRRYGVIYKMEDGRPWIIIANNNIYIQQWLKDTHFNPNWAKWLKRIREKINGEILTAQGITPRIFDPDQPPARGVMIPYEIAARYLDTEVS